MQGRKIESNWIQHFKSCPLIDPKTQTFNGSFAYRLFYGRVDESYPENFPHHFSDFYENFQVLDREIVIEKLLVYLHFVGIKISKNKILLHVEKYPDDYIKLLKKCRYIFKTLAHYDESLDINNPFRDNPGDISFLLRIESGESFLANQLHLFEDAELPQLYRKLSQLPENYENDEVITELFRRIENTNDSFFITGKAGTGKSTFIHYFAKKTQKKVLMMAFTGIAAMNAGGQTIHSFFRLPLKPLLPGDHEITLFEQATQKFKIIQKTDTFIIDEVSMLRSDILEAIDFSLRHNGGNPHKPFGGKQILFVGDIFQLPPVTAEIIDGIRFQEIYASEYFFHAPAYKKMNPLYFEFKVSHRQKNDQEFVEMLDKIRICKTDQALLNTLNERYAPDYQPTNEEFVIKLTADNAIANAENAMKLRELPYADLPPFEAEITGEFAVQKFPTAKTLELKKNAQVIFIKNDTGKKWVNGTIAKIDFITKDFIEIRLQDGSIHRLEKETWENRRYKFDKTKNRIISEITGTFKQYPIRLAWAITIHKSQGLSFDQVIIDMGRGAFVNGQVYTALSRCRTLQGIKLTKKLRKEDIISDKRIIDFHETEQLLSQLKENESN